MPLTPAQTELIKATVPILREGGETLTKHFYKMMLSEFPSVRPLFNTANQASGRQPRALAASVLAYAENIDQLQNLGPVAAQIVNKHVALQVQPEQYPIVGGCLLRSIREVLGPQVATDAVIDAWAAAYGQLADILIGAEKKAYDEAAAAVGGWRGARSFTVAKKVKESTNITSFYLEPADAATNKAVISYLPGQYLGLQLYVGDATNPDAEKRELRRNYSISQAADGKSLRITVKREEGGVASTYLHDTVQEGDALNVFPPAGCFTFDSDKTFATSTRSTVFLTAGVGITPAMAMLQHASAALKATGAADPIGKDVRFVHYAKSPAHQAFAKDVEAIVATHPNTMRSHYYYGGSSASAAHSFDEWLVPSCAATTDVYLLGPAGFMRAMKEGLEGCGVPTENIKYEFFGPAEALA